VGIAPALRAWGGAWQGERRHGARGAGAAKRQPGPLSGISRHPCERAARCLLLFATFWLGFLGLLGMLL
jgi:hypothetical protein